MEPINQRRIYLIEPYATVGVALHPLYHSEESVHRQPEIRAQRTQGEPLSRAGFEEKRKMREEFGRRVAAEKSYYCTGCSCARQVRTGIVSVPSRTYYV